MDAVDDHVHRARERVAALVVALGAHHEAEVPVGRIGAVPFDARERAHGAASAVRSDDVLGSDATHSAGLDVLDGRDDPVAGAGIPRVARVALEE